MSKLPQAAMLVTSLVVGVTMVMGPNAINSAPSFMLEYYKYLAGNKAAEALSPVFWRNILNFYTVVTIVAQAIHEPTNLTSFMCRFSLLFRLEVSCVLMTIELLVILIMPHTNAPEYGAIAALMIVAYLGGAARAYFENTGYALFGPCPPIMMTGMLVGSAVSGSLVSVLQIVLKVSMSDTYNAVLTQSLIYFCLAIGIIFLSGLLLMILPYNPYARRYVAEFRSSRGLWANIYCPREAVKEMSDDGVCRKNGAAGLQDRAACRYLADSGSEKKAELLLETEHGDVTARGIRARHHPNLLYDDRFFTREGFEAEPTQEFAPEPGSHDGAAVNATETVACDCAYPQTTSGEVSSEVVTQTKADLDGDSNDCPAAADRMLTTAELLQEVKLWPVIKKIYPMMIACFLTFCATYLVYPGIIVAVDSADGWFTTLIIAAYNFADLVGRLLTLWRRLWPSRKVILIASITRIIFIPLLVLCAVHKIPSKAAAYVFTIIMGLSNGFVGALSMIYSPETPSLSTDGERAMAGQLTGACLLIGCAAGSLIQLAEVLPFT
ncbi:nucleobase transporter [Leishmania donovani]|uniref:Nucleobase transporter n=1 Tax=Leishmania donovani TaxID=5661 RepID=E9BAP0_LEIDO|nr:nucleobase transporter [Leishmania donovani]TPP53041.1 Nucleoside transporter family protein [Leishmania donovani]CBZ32315.1 nucleobase transporter [Leishmania donovani]